MEYSSFNRLVNILSPHMCRKENKSPVAVPITTELIAAISIRYQSGEKIRSFKDIFGMLCTAVYRSRDMFLDAVLTNKLPA